jgi:hypothetical protein
MGFTVDEEIAYYDPEDRRSWDEGGTWPHSHHYHFNEAVVAAHFVLQGYHVLRDFSSTRPQLKRRPLAAHSTALLHDIVGSEASAFFQGELEAATRGGTGEPDLFVFREDHPRDPKYRFVDDRDWFFVEVKGPGDVVGDEQRRFWHLVAERLGEGRIRLFRTAPRGETFGADSIAY